MTRPSPCCIGGACAPGKNSHSCPRGLASPNCSSGSDGIWYAYAQWPGAEARARAFAAGSVDAQASEAMRNAIAEALPEVILEVVEDHLLR